MDNCHTLNVNCFAVSHVPFIARQPQNKGMGPIVKPIQYVKGVFCIDQLCSVQPVTNVHIVAQKLLVGARLIQFWKRWAALRASPKVTGILKEGYTIPSQN